MTLADFLLLCLASAAVVDVWRHGSLFAERRKAVDDAFVAYSARGLSPFHINLLSCWYCLSYWAPAVLVALFVLPGVAWPPLRPYISLPLASLAATRAVVMANGLLPAGLGLGDAEPAATPAPPEFVDVDHTGRG